MSLQSVFAELLADSSSILRGNIQGNLGLEGVIWFVCLFVLHGFKSLEEMHYRKQQQDLILKGVTLPLHLPTVVNTVQQKKRDPKKFHLSAGLVNQTGSAVLKRSWMFFFSIFSFSVTLSVTVTAGGTVSVCRPHSGSSPLLLQWNVFQLRICSYSLKR